MNVPVTARCVLLQLLARGPSYGLEMIQRAQRVTGGALRLHQGGVYPALAAMEKEGLIETVAGPDPDPGLGGKPPHSYRLTVRGRAVAIEQRAVLLAVAGAAEAA